MTSSKPGKEYDNTAYYYLAYLTSVQSTSCEMPGWMDQQVESRFLGEISTPLDVQMIPL